MGCRFIVLGVALAALQAQSPAQRSNTTKRALSTEDARRTRAWKLLNDAAAENNPEKREKAIRALGLLGGERHAVELAESALSDKEPGVREAAAGVLGEMPSLRSAPKLIAATADNNLSVALAAAHSLLAMKNRAGYEVYYEVMTGERKGGGRIKAQLDDLKEPKKTLEFAFQQGIGFAPYAGAALEAYEMLTKKDTSPLRATAAGALASDPDPRTGAALARTLQDKNWIVRVAVLRAIAVRQDKSALDRIEAALQDKQDEVSFTAAAAVLRITGPRN
jgi:HEAT repeat protein